MGGEQLHQHLVRRLVAGVLELATLQTLGAHLQQPLARDRRQPLGEDVVIRTGRRGAVVVVVAHGVTLEPRRSRLSG